MYYKILNNHSMLQIIATFCIWLYLCIPFVSMVFERYKIIEVATTLLCMLLLFLTLCISKNARLKLPGTFLLLILFYVYVLVNNNISISNGSGLIWFVQFFCTIIFVLIVLSYSNQYWTNTTLSVISFFGLLYSFATIIFWLIPSLYEIVYPFLRSMSSSQITEAGYKSGLTIHYSTNGMYIALGFLASGCLALDRKNKRWCYAAIICLLALVLTSKRAHLAFGLAAFGVSYLIYNSNKKVSSFGKLLLVSVSAVVALYIISFVNADILDVFARFGEMSKDDTMNGRSGFYALCIDMFRANQLTGQGWGSYTVYFNQTVDGARYVADGFKTMNAHNVFLQVLAEEGLIGFVLLFGTLFAVLFITIFQLFKLNHLLSSCHNVVLNNCRTLLAASAGFQLFFLMYCCTGNPLYDMQMYIPFIFALGIKCSVSYQLKTPTI